MPGNRCNYAINAFKFTERNRMVNVYQGGKTRDHHSKITTYKYNI
jgi:hypothetical protein